MQFGGFGSTIFGPHFILLIWMFGSFFKRKNKKNREKYFSFFFLCRPLHLHFFVLLFFFLLRRCPFLVRVCGCVGVCVCVCVCPPHLHIFVFFRRCPFLAWVCRCVCVCVCVCNRIELLRRPPSFVDIFVVFFWEVSTE